METCFIFYELDGQVISEPDPIANDYIPESPPIGLDMSIESLFTPSFDHFTIEPIETSAAASGQSSAVEQISPISTVSTRDSSDDSPQSTSEVIIISDNEDIEEIKIVDLTSEDNEDLEMDIEILELISDSDLVATSASSFGSSPI
ncbi:hypothetical protein AHAS_Ahas06G0157800 [Arachis hypogaea]